MKKIITCMMAMLGLTKDDFIEKAKAVLPADKTIAVYCRSGRRSASAAGRLAEVGYKCVNLKGGIIAWQAADMPVATDNIRKL